MIAPPLFLDIETVPCQWPDIRSELAENIKPPANYSKPETIAAWERDTKPGLVDAAYLETGLDGGYGQICCIGWALGDGQPHSVCVGDLSAAEETHLLELVIGSLPAPSVLVGHNVLAFDLPFIRHRCIVRRVRLPSWWPRDPKPWGGEVFDTMLQWAGARGRIGLVRLCKILGIEPPIGSGGEVWQWVQDGRMDLVAEHCRDDVRATRDVYRRIVWS